MNRPKYIRESELNKESKTFTNLNSRHVVLMNKLIQFYSKQDYLDELTSIIDGDSNLSLRIIDYFVTNYSRENEIIYEHLKKNFMIYYSYKSQLKAYSKKQFDPFCRRERILLYIDKYNGIQEKPLRTTVGQLNFFRWAIENKILDYMYKNYDDIEEQMNIYSKNKSLKKSLNKKSSKEKLTKEKLTTVKQPNENILTKNKSNKNTLTLSATKKVNKHNVTITVKFN